MHQYACPHCRNVFAFAFPPGAGTTAQATCPTCQQVVTLTRPVEAVPATAGTGAEPLIAAQRTSPRRGPAKRRRSSSGWWLLGGSTLVLLVVGGGILWQLRDGVLSPAGAEKNEPSAPVVNSSESSAAAPTSSAPPWTDARSRGVRLGDYEVRIKRAEWGRLLGRDASNNVITADEQALQLVMTIRNVARAERPYQSWYAEESVDRDEPLVELADNHGVYYPVALYEDVRLRGHTLTATLDRGETIEDLLVFALPEETDRRMVEYLHLRLAGERQGLAGAVQLEIPTSMIRNWQ